jgi:dUTP pyrophosphatase
MAQPVEVRLRRVRPGADPLPLPRYQTDGSAGLDLHADLERPMTVAPGERVVVPTGIALAIPDGFEGQIRPRSGLARRHGLTLVNTPGTIDADYRGEVQVLVINHGDEAVILHRGDRIAQLIIAPVARAMLVEVDELDDTGRGAGGFGHTGGKRHE